MPSTSYSILLIILLFQVLVASEVTGLIALREISRDSLKVTADISRELINFLIFYSTLPLIPRRNSVRLMHGRDAGRDLSNPLLSTRRLCDSIYYLFGSVINFDAWLAYAFASHRVFDPGISSRAHSDLVQVCVLHPCPPSPPSSPLTVVPLHLHQTSHPIPILFKRPRPPIPAKLPYNIHRRNG
jgi:hypothetical protein